LNLDLWRGDSSVMFIVDNFKIILLVGLICSAGITPSDAITCADGYGSTSAKECEKDKQACTVDQIRSKCGYAGNCALPEGKNFTCIKKFPNPYCCCITDLCNSLKVEDKDKSNIKDNLDELCSSEIGRGSECAALREAFKPTTTPGPTTAPPPATAVTGGPPDNSSSPPATPGDPTTNSTAAGLFEHYYGGFPLATLVAAWICYSQLKTFF